MKFSNTTRYQKRETYELTQNKGKWLVGYDYIVLTLVVMVVSFSTFTFFNELPANIIQITTFQLIMLVVGLVGGVLLTEGNIRLVFPTRKYVEETLLSIVAGFVFSTIALTLAMNSLTGMSLFDFNKNFGLSAAIVEEALYSFVLTIGAWKFSAYFVRSLIGKGELETWLEVVGASIVVSILFGIGHIAVYGLSPAILGIMVSRFVVAILFLKTRNLIVPTGIHLLNNFLVLFG